VNPPTSNIVIVLYCYAINDWNERLSAQLERIKTSGLYDASDNLNLVIADPDEKHYNDITHIVSKYPKWKLLYTTLNRYEATALSHLDAIARASSENNHKILYLHTKGVFNKYKNFETLETHELKINGIKCWTDILETCVIDRWKECVAWLDEVDTVGATNNGNWWWGNFWWATSSYIKQIIPFEKYYNGSRWSAEDWLHGASIDKSKIKFKELYNFQFDPYYTVLPKYFYDNSDITDVELIINKAEYGCFSEQRDEGQPTPTHSVRIIDITDVGGISTTKTSISINGNIIAGNVEDICHGEAKAIRLYFSTNRDLQTEYVITTFPGYQNNIMFDTTRKFYT
jgi:hypothetical protein